MPCGGRKKYPRTFSLCCYTSSCRICKYVHCVQPPELHLTCVLCCSGGCLLCMLCFLHELFPLIYYPQKCPVCRVAVVKSLPAHVVMHRLAGCASSYIAFGHPNCIWLAPCGRCLCSSTLGGVLCYVFRLNSPVDVYKTVPLLSKQCLGFVLFGWLSAV